MRVRQHLSSIFVIALGVLLGTLYLVDRGSITDRERKDRDHDVFPAYRRGDIDGFELTQGDVTVRVQRRPDGGDAGETYWQMTSPVDERADPAAVDRFIGDLEFAGAIRKVDPNASPEIAQGFERARVHGTLSMKPLVYRFALGGSAPLPEGSAYFRVDGEGTYVVSKDFVTSLLNGAETYRERTVVPYLSLDLAELDVQVAGAGFTVVRADDISFKLAGTGERVSRDGLDKVWGALAEARAESFLTDRDADRALASTPVRVKMTPRDKSKPNGELLLGGACPGHPEDIVLVRITPKRASACVPKGALLGLSMTSEALVDRRLFAARADEVAEISFETVPPDLTVEIARKGRGWHERKPHDRELFGTEVDTANDLVTALTRADAIRVERGSGETPFRPRARVVLRRGGTETIETVELGPGNELVRRDFDGATLDVPGSLGRRLLPSEIVLRGRSVFPDAIEGWAPSVVKAKCDDVDEVLTKAGASVGAGAPTWAFTKPAGYAADALATADLIALVRNAQAEAWVADKDESTFGFEGSRCQVELSGAADGGSRTVGLVFGKQAETGAFYARATSGPAIFLAPRALREGPATWLIDRGAFHVDAGAIRTVTLSRAASHVTFDGRSGRGDASSNDTTSRLFAALQVLRPEAVLHLGPPRPSEGFSAPALDVRVGFLGDAGAAPAKDLHFVLGDTAFVSGERLIFARVDGVNATYGLARDRLSALLDAL